MTASGTSKHALLCAGVFIGVMMIGVYQVVIAIPQLDRAKIPLSFTDFREGKATQTLEKQLDLQLPIRSNLIAIASTVRYQLVGGGGEQVRVGRDGWLFLTDELKYEKDESSSGFGLSNSLNSLNSPLRARVELISKLAKHLEAFEVKLVVALVPDKARLYAEQLESGGYPAYNQTRYFDALSALRERKVETVNLLTRMSAQANHAELYYRTDTHWNQQGARLAATEIAAAITKLNLNLKKSSFTTQVQGGLEERPGDLIRLMGLEQVPNAWRPKPDQERIVATTQAPAESNGQSLFGDAGIPVVLVGTSYSLRGNFHGYLQESLSAQVLNGAKDGGGFLQALTTYLKDDAFRENKPQVLVWEILERMLGSPLTEERTWLEDMKAVALLR